MSQLLEEILSRENMMRAYKRVVANKGASGVDGITTEEVRQYLIEHWEEIRKQIQTQIDKTEKTMTEGFTPAEIEAFFDYVERFKQNLAKCE